MSQSPTVDLRSVEYLVRLPVEEALPAAAEFLDRFPLHEVLLPRSVQELTAEAHGRKEPFVPYEWKHDEGEFALGVFVWPSAAQTQIHDHVSWGVVRCIAGMIVEERYERTDDRATVDEAHLRLLWRAGWRPGDPVSTLMPYDGGIHRMSNPSPEVAISLHLYGPRVGPVDGRDYDPSRNYVCDRLVDGI